MWIKFAAALFIPLSLVAILVAILKQQYLQAGKLLVDLSKPSWQGLILFGLTALVVVANVRSQNVFLLGGFFGITASLWLQFLSPTQLRDKGILTAGKFIRWSQIETYRWQKQNKYSWLKFRSGHWHKRWRLRIPTAKIARVEQILQKKVNI